MFGQTPAAADSLTCYAVYPAPEKIVDTPAPKGYKPFYISTYNRHGSRYIESSKMVSSYMGPLQKAESKGLLTEEGRKLLKVVGDMTDATSGQTGMLSPLGEREVADIAARTAERYPTVFAGRDSVFCRVSTAVRCIMSMNYWTFKIKEKYPYLQFRFAVGGEHQSVINNAEGMEEIRAVNNEMLENHFFSSFDYESFLSRFFTDPAKMKQYVASPMEFVRNMYLLACDAPCMEYSGSTFFDFITSSQTHALWESYNMHLFLNHCHSEVTGNRRQAMQQSLIDDIVARGDQAVAGCARAMDVRFGHDAALMSLMSYIGIEGYDVTAGAGDCCTKWVSDRMVPMGANFMLVFYKNKAGKVLVKPVFNEREISVPSLGEGPYYTWEDFKAYLSARGESFRK